MAHPQKAESEAMHSAKLKAMTSHYGAADPAMNQLAPDDVLKNEGPEDAVGFGADSSAPRARADRAGRGKRTTAANPVATYRKGGRVKAKHRDTGGAADVSTIEEANRDQAMSKPAERARGGRMKGKGGGHTHVNVIVAPQGAGGPGAGAMPPPVIPIGAAPPPAAPMPPKPPMMPPGGAPMGGGMPMAPGAPGGMPPGLMPPRAKGGRVHADEAEDRALFKKMMKEEKHTKRARGGKVDVADHMTAGAVTGIGRLEKIKMQEKHESKKAQAV